VYGIALSVAACLRAGTKVDVAWIVASDDFPDRDVTDAIAITPGGGRVGALLSGALVEIPVSGRVVDVSITDVDALVAGLTHGGTARVVTIPAADLPPDLWEQLLRRQPVGLVVALEAGNVTGVELFAPDAPGETLVSDEQITTIFWPVPKLVVVGGGPIAGALSDAAALLGWHVEITNDAATATGLIAALAPLDKVVVAAHDLELAGPALAAALDSEVGYIGALGGRKMQQTRADWLAYRGITEIDRVHAPAGLDIGADTPPKIAISILAEAIAAEAAETSLRTLGGDESPVP
jgi:xanthine dehydrogenase accessory factor